MGLRILVTGGAGYIGSSAGALLLRHSHSVTVLDNLSRGKREAVPDGARLIVGDIGDQSCLERVFSEGRFDAGNAERLDVAAALDFAESDELPAIWLLGWSFGSDLALRYGCDPTVVGAVLLAPPLRFSTEADLDAWAASNKPLVAIVPQYDDFLRPDRARERFARVPQGEVVAVADARHLFVGARSTDRVLDEVVRRVNPPRYPLPRHWPPPDAGS